MRFYAPQPHRNSKAQIQKRTRMFLPPPKVRPQSRNSRSQNRLEIRTYHRHQKHNVTMAPISLSDIISALPSEDSWGPPTSTETTLNGVPYAPYSKGDKLGRMADWTAEGKDGRDGRGGRQQYNRNYRGLILCLLFILPYTCCISLVYYGWEGLR